MEDEKVNEKFINKKSEMQIKLDNYIILAKTCSYTEFITFRSINDIFELIYIYKIIEYHQKKIIINSIICYDLTNFQKINEIKNEKAFEIKYIFDSFNKRDLLLSHSDEYIKIWNINTIEVLFKLDKNFYKVCLMKEKEQILFIGNINIYQTALEIYDLKKELKKIIKGIKFENTFIEIINNNSSIYILLIQDELKNRSKMSHIISYDYYRNRIYKKYLTNEKKWIFDGYNLQIYKNNNSIKLLIINGLFDKIVLVDFYSGEITQELKIDKPYQICLWNEHYLIGYYLLYENNFKTIIKLLDVKNGAVIKDLKTLIQKDCNPYHFKKIIHPFYGECLIGFEYNSIILLTNKK